MKDQTVPIKKWEFDEDVTEVFTDMLERSIPQYEVMRQSVFDLGRQFVQDETYIVDLGCSNGLALEPFVNWFMENNGYVGYEISPPMLKKARERLEGTHAQIIEADLRNGLPYSAYNPSLILSILTLQFIPMEYRQDLLYDCYQRLEEGGAFILVEKVLGDTAPINQAFIKQYLDLKADNQYTQEQIESKRRSLEGVLVPVTAKWNEDLLRQAGFRSVDCFWRFGNFAGWLALKD